MKNFSLLLPLACCVPLCMAMAAPYTRIDPYSGRKLPSQINYEQIFQGVELKQKYKKVPSYFSGYYDAVRLTHNKRVFELKLCRARLNEAPISINGGDYSYSMPELYFKWLSALQQNSQSYHQTLKQEAAKYPVKPSPAQPELSLPEPEQTGGQEPLASVEGKRVIVDLSHAQIKQGGEWVPMPHLGKIMQFQSAPFDAENKAFSIELEERAKTKPEDLFKQAHYVEKRVGYLGQGESPCPPCSLDIQYKLTQDKARLSFSDFGPAYHALFCFMLELDFHENQQASAQGWYWLGADKIPLRGARVRFTEK